MAKHAFEAEVSQILRLVVHSLYSHHEIFLRELVSNASDALDRLRFRAVTDPSATEGDTTMEIRLRADPDAGVLRIEDTGVGMTEEELVRNLGTIAYSGTRRLLEQLSDDEKKNLSLIGQFGVGFYSAFLVADRVDVISRAAGPDQKAFKWSSDAKDSFTVEPAERATRGTEIVLHLKSEHKEFLDAWRLRELVRKYSDYVSWPIKLEAKDKDGPKLEQINKASALWQRPRAEITNEQYEELYKHLTHDYEPPLAHTHFHVEGTMDLVGLLFIPKRPPHDLFDAPTRRRGGLRLFVKRVFILDDCDAFLPQWLRFARGVVDSEDLPLNVSRELLQDSAVVRQIKKACTKKLLELIEDLAENKKELYAEFWKTYGRVMKEAPALPGEAYEYEERIAKLLRFESTAADGLVSLSEYKARMKEGQKAIYYLTGSRREQVTSSPYLEALREKGYEVLVMTDPVDDWCCEGLGEFDGVPLVSATRADLKLDAASEKKGDKSEQEKSVSPLLDRIRKVLAGRIKDAAVSERLVESPACLAIAEGGMSAQVEAIMKAAGRKVLDRTRVLEVNAKHPLIQRLAKRAESAPEDPDLAEWIEVLYDQTRLAEGAAIEDPSLLAKRIGKLLERSVV
jgi:molecular chaperone HtpG